MGFLGLGIMGTAMARNLLKAGYPVTAWNRNPDKCTELVAEGATAAKSPKEVTASSDITIAMLADPVAAVEVACGEGKAVLGLAPGKGYIDASTVDADSVRTIAAAVRAQGAQYLEAPVSGSKKPAEDGTLIFLAAGDKELYDQASGILDVLGKYKVYLGAEGNGASMKLVVNMIMGSMMTAFSEGLALGERAGLDQKDILDVIAQGAITSPMFTMKGPGMVAGNYPPAFPLKHQQKDLRLALALGDELNQPLPVAAAANEVFKAAKTQGLGDNDFSAVVEAVKRPSAKQ